MKHPTNFVDLFTSTLQPMVHYVPIKPDLSDIEQQVNYVLDEKNSDEMDNIVNNAQSWCRQHMVSVCVCVCVFTPRCFEVRRLFVTEFVL